MSTFGIFKMAAVAAMVTLFAVAAQTQAQQAPAASVPPPTKVGTINVVRVFDSLNEKKQADTDLETLGVNLRNQRVKMEEEVNKLNEELKDYKPDSDIANETREKMLKKAMELRSFAEYMEQKIQLEQRLKITQIYRHIVASIEAYAKQNGFILVLVSDDMDLSGTRSGADLLAKIAMRKVIYAHESLDITEKVIAKMNSEFKLGGK